VTVASAGPYANQMHRTLDRQSHPYLTTQFFNRLDTLLLPNQQHQSTEGNFIWHTVIKLSV